MVSIGGLFSDFHEQVKEKWYEVEAALVNMTEPKSRQRNTTVREPSILLAGNLYDTEREEFQPLTSRVHTGVHERCQKSRCVPDEEEDLLNSRQRRETGQPERKLAQTAQPQMLHFIAPEDARPGMTVCIRGPHGEPIRVQLPDGAKPGEPTSVYLGPRMRLQVVVPEGAGPGMTVWFESEGDTLHTVVPPGKKAGDMLEIVPPVVLIQVPLGVNGGEEIMFRTPAGAMAVAEVPRGYMPGHYFASMPPMDPEIMARCLKDLQREGAPLSRSQEVGASSPSQAISFAGYGPSASSSSAPPPAQPADGEVPQMEDLLDLATPRPEHLLDLQKFVLQLGEDSADKSALDRMGQRMAQQEAVPELPDCPPSPTTPGSKENQAPDNAKVSEPERPRKDVETENVVTPVGGRTQLILR